MCFGKRSLSWIISTHGSEVFDKHSYAEIHDIEKLFGISSEGQANFSIATFKAVHCISCYSTESSLLDLYSIRARLSPTKHPFFSWTQLREKSFLHISTKKYLILVSFVRHQHSDKSHFSFWHKYENSIFEAKQTNLLFSLTNIHLIFSMVMTHPFPSSMFHWNT